MDPVIKDPGSKGSSKGCPASKQVVGNRYCNWCNGVAKECGVWGCSPNVWLSTCATMERGRGSPTYAIYIFITVYSICTVCNTVVSTNVQFNVQSCKRAGRLAIHDCTLFGTVVSMVSCHSGYRIGVIPTAESHRTSVT